PGMPGAHRLLGDIDVARARAGVDPEANAARAIDEYRAALTDDPLDEDACRSLAELYYHSGRMDEGRQVLEQMASRRPLDGSMSLLLGKIYVRTGHYEQAEGLLAAVVAGSPLSLEAGDALGALYEYEKKYDEAIEVYTRLVDNGGATAYLLDRIGSLQLQAGRSDAAIRALEQGQTLDPTDTRGLLTLAQAYEGSGRQPDAAAAYDRIIEREPGNLEARFDKARLLQKQGDAEGSLAGYRALVDLTLGRGAVTEREAAILALTYSQIGLIEMEARDFHGAADAFGKALDASSDPGPELFFLLGRANLDGGRPDEAQRVVLEASRRFPGDLDLRVLQGEVLIVRGDFPKAREFYDALLKDQKGSPEAYARVSEALVRQKRFEEAEQILRDGIRLHPADDTLLFTRGAAMERMGRIGEAERSLARAIRLNPKNAMALNYLGYMWADRGVRLQDSIDYVQRALALDPDNPAYLDSLGWAQFKMRMYDAAEKNLRAAARADQFDPTIRDHLGDLLQATGRVTEAVKEWQGALDRGHEEPERVREKIEKARAALKPAP
ncbi:MAG TPA: tetratricopeptide repeat protein, partial [Candidatus Polarisedimenticolia bacterium]|nr:tetratricopeptide repeat protein [Candidatus Polarisedimenticolia bacterium]